jgi:hypothetical protein
MRRSVVFALGVALLLTACRGASQALNAPAASEHEVFFPTQPVDTGVYMAALIRGPLVVRERCVLIGGSEEFTLPVWRKGFTPDWDESGRLVVLDNEGAVVAVEGETFEMGGGYRVEFYPGEEPRDVQLQRLEEWLGYAIPERCLRRDVYGVWLVGET